MEYIRGRYSWLLRPALILFDISIIVFFASYFIDFKTFGLPYWSFGFIKSKATFFVFYVSILWLISAYSIKFYNLFIFNFSFLIYSFYFYFESGAYSNKLIGISS